MIEDPNSRIAQLETVLAVLIDLVEEVGCWTEHGHRLTDHVPAVHQAKLVLGEGAYTRVLGKL